MTRSSMGSSSGRPSPRTAIACATACASCGSRPGRTPPATGPRCGWPRPVPPSCGSPPRRPDRAGDPAPDLVVTAGGVWSSVPAPTVALALVDVLRRPGRQPVRPRPRPAARRRSARSPTPDERLTVMADLADDLLAPLGSVVTPAGLRAGRTRRRPASSTPAATATELDLVPGRAGARGPAAGRARDGRVPVPGHRPPGRRAAAISRSTSAAASAACSSTCATSRSGCPSAPTAGATCSRRGRRRCGRGRTNDRGPIGRRADDAPTLAGDLGAGRPAADRRTSRRGAVRAGARRPGAGRGRRDRSSSAPRSPSACATPGSIEVVASPDDGRCRREPGGRVAERRATCSTGTGAGGSPPATSPSRRDARSRASSARSGPGSAITVRAGGRAMRGIVALGGPTRGRLHVATGKDGELRSGGLDVGFAGTILVVGSRIDAETLTRARAMGVRGVDRERLREQGAARLPGVGGAPAGRPPSPAAVRGPRPRRGAPPAAGRARSRPCSTALVGSRGRDRHRPADARLRRARTSSSRRRPSTSSGSARARMPGARARWVGPAGPAPVRGRRPPGGRCSSGCADGDRSSPSRSATWSGSADASATLGTMTADDPGRRRTIVCPDPATPRAALGRALADRRRGRATSSACGATSGPARPTSPRRSGPGWGDRHDHLAELHPDGRVRGPAAALPPRPVPARRRGRRPGRRPDRRPPGGGRHARRVAGAAGRRPPPTGSTSHRRVRRRAADDHARAPARRRPTARYLGGRRRDPRRTPPRHPRHRHRDDAGRRRDRLARRASLDGVATWPAGYRHGETLLPSIGRFLGEQNIRRSRLDRRSSSGPGPARSPACGSGIATAKGLAHGLGCPIVGVSTARGAARRRPRRWRGRRASCCCRPARRTGSSSGAASRPDLLPGRRGAGRWRRRDARRGRPRRPRARPTPSSAARRPAPGSAAALLPARGARRLRAPATPTTSPRSCPSTSRCRAGSRAASRGGGMVARPPVRLRIEPMRLEDLAAVHAIERASFDAPWPADAYRSELETNRLAHYLVARVGDEIVGYGGMWLMVDEAHITTFASTRPGVASASASGCCWRSSTSPSTAAPTRRRSRSGSRTCRRAGCTRSTASGRSACGRATTATTTRTR